tara:strand:- start:67 stop:780 length:714 start_codon:yes stop_codon:yes gene_type:complete
MPGHKYPKIIVTSWKFASVAYNNTLLSGRLNEKQDKSSVFYIYDALYINTKHYTKMNLIERHQLINVLLKSFNSSGEVVEKIMKIPLFNNNMINDYYTWIKKHKVQIIGALFIHMTDCDNNYILLKENKKSILLQNIIDNIHKNKYNGIFEIVAQCQRNDKNPYIGKLYIMHIGSLTYLQNIIIDTIVLPVDIKQFDLLCRYDYQMNMFNIEQIINDKIITQWNGDIKRHVPPIFYT